MTRLAKHICGEISHACWQNVRIKEEWKWAEHVTLWDSTCTFYYELLLLLLLWVTLDESSSSLWIPDILFVMRACICVFVMACYPGYSAPGTPTANRFVGLSPRDPAFLHQQQVRSSLPSSTSTQLLLSFFFLSHISPHIMPSERKKPVAFWIWFAGSLVRSEPLRNRSELSQAEVEHRS